MHVISYLYARVGIVFSAAIAKGEAASKAGTLKRIERAPVRRDLLAPDCLSCSLMLVSWVWLACTAPGAKSSAEPCASNSSAEPCASNRCARRGPAQAANSLALNRVWIAVVFPFAITVWVGWRFQGVICVCGGPVVGMRFWFCFRDGALGAWFANVPCGGPGHDWCIRLSFPPQGA